jgi:predicted nucleotidyltransferase
VNGWVLRKTLQLLRQSNPPLLDWLRSPIVYRKEADTLARLRALAEDDFSAMRGYLDDMSMATKTLREHLHAEEVRYKKYLSLLRPLLAETHLKNEREKNETD